MVKRQHRYDKEEIARLGRAMYQKRVRRKVAGEKKGRVVALDVDTGDFAVADDALTATDLLRKRRPHARAYLARVGYRTYLRFGAWHDEGDAE